MYRATYQHTLIKCITKQNAIITIRLFFGHVVGAGILLSTDLDTVAATADAVADAAIVAVDVDGSCCALACAALTVVRIM